MADHLGIELAEYDRQIRTFIPYYDEVLDEAARLVEPRSRRIVDLGIGTGALTLRCLARAPGARVVGLDLDPEMVVMAKSRLGGKPVTVIQGNLETFAIPRCDAIVSSYALHHIRTKSAKLAFYKKAFAAVRPAGVLINADCCPSSDPTLASREMLEWQDHLSKEYGNEQALNYLRMWAKEDVYRRLNDEHEMMKAPGFHVDVAWRRGAFAVLMGRRPGIR